MKTSEQGGPLQAPRYVYCPDCERDDNLEIVKTVSYPGDGNVTVDFLCRNCEAWGGRFQIALETMKTPGGKPRVHITQFDITPETKGSGQ